MTPTEVGELARLVHWALRKYRHQPEYEDLHQEAMVAAWRAVESNNGKWENSTVAVRAAKWQAIDWTRRQRGDTRNPPRPVMLSLDCLRDVDGGDFHPAFCCSEDGYGRVLDEMEGAGLWDDLRRLVNEQDFTMVWEVVGRGQTIRSVAVKFDICPSSATRRIESALHRLQDAHDQPRKGLRAIR